MKKSFFTLLILCIQFFCVAQSKTTNPVSIISPRVLYLGCTYHVNIPVSKYGKGASLTVKGSRFMPTTTEDEYKIIPNKKQVVIDIIVKETSVYSDTLEAIKTPNLSLSVNLNNSRFPIRKAVHPCDSLKDVKLDVFCKDSHFNKAFLKGRKFKVTEFEITAIRGRTEILNKTVRGNRLKPLLDVQEGDRVIIRVTGLRGPQDIYGGQNIAKKNGLLMFNVAILYPPSRSEGFFEVKWGVVGYRWIYVFCY